MKIGVLDSGYDSYSIEKSYLKQYDFDLEVYEDHFGERIEKIEFAKDKAGLLIRQTEINKEFLDQCPQLQAIVRYGIGYDNIDLTEAGKRNIKVANVQGYATKCVSEHAMALMLACLRGLPKGEKEIHAHYGKPPRQDIFELHDITLGIIGLGRIGTRFAQICRPLFDRILAVDPYVTDDHFKKNGVTRATLPELFENSHVISIHCSLTEETRYLINRKSIEKMKCFPILINTARGPVVNEKDLLQALNENRIHSAGIDVWEDEPTTIRQQDLIDHVHVIATGHYAWYSRNAVTELQKRAAENIIGLLTGKMVADQLV
jgi:D-3-phosphoglycerate dehydrogenase